MIGCSATLGSRRGVHVVWDADELDDVSSGDGPIFAQRWLRPDGRERKIYCIGGQLFGVVRAWPARTFDEKVGEAFALGPELREIALACGRAFGVDVFALDVLVSDGRPYVVNMQSLPGRWAGLPAGRDGQARHEGRHGAEQLLAVVRRHGPVRLLA